MTGVKSLSEANSWSADAAAALGPQEASREQRPARPERLVSGVAKVPSTTGEWRFCAPPPGRAKLNSGKKPTVFGPLAATVDRRQRCQCGLSRCAQH